MSVAIAMTVVKSRRRLIYTGVLLNLLALTLSVLSIFWALVFGMSPFVFFLLVASVIVVLAAFIVCSIEDSADKACQNKVCGLGVKASVIHPSDVTHETKHWWFLHVQITTIDDERAP